MKIKRNFLKITWKKTFHFKSILVKEDEDEDEITFAIENFDTD